MDISVLLPFVPRRHEAVLPYAALVQWTSARRLWQGHSPTIDAHDTFIYAAASGFRIPMALGVSLMPVRAAYQAAIQARSVAMASGNEFVAGFGPGETLLQERLLGKPYEHPVAETAAYASRVKAVLVGSGQSGDAVGGALAVPSPKVDVAVGALGAGMASAAGRVADQVVGWMTPPQYFADAVGVASARAAEQSGRTRPRLVVIVPTSIVDGRHDVATYVEAAVGRHLESEPYRRMLKRAGTLDRAGGSGGLATALVEERGALVGSKEFVVEALQEFEECGIDEVVLNTTGSYNVSGPNDAREDLIGILEAF